jgi:hypothetical protein
MNHPWQKAEVNALLELVGTDEATEVIRAFRNLATKEGWPARQPGAILTKIKRLKFSRVAQHGGWNCTGLAEILGCDRDRVHDWVARKLLKTSRRQGRRHHRILEKDFIDFAQNHPEWLRDIDLDRLGFLLPEPLVEAIADLPDRTRGVRFQVRSTQTGKVYSSLRQASRQEYFSKSRIAKIIKHGGSTRDGKSFQLIARGAEVV